MRTLEDGQGMVEYALIILLIAIAAVSSLTLLGPLAVRGIQAGVNAFP